MKPEQCLSKTKYNPLFPTASDQVSPLPPTGDGGAGGDDNDFDIIHVVILLFCQTC